MTTVALFNIKGGVGKTAAAVNLAHAAAREGARVLLWDLDPQGAASYFVQREEDATAAGDEITWMTSPRGIEDAIQPTRFERLDLVPADRSLRHLNMALIARDHPTRVLSTLLEPVEARYDYVIADAPPGLSIVAENVFTAADVVVVPTIPTTLSMRTLDQLRVHLDGSEGYRPAVLPFLSMVDRRRKLHQEISKEVFRDRDFLAAWVPYASPVEKMGVHRRPIADFARGSAPARAYELLWTEIEGRISGQHASSMVDDEGFEGGTNGARIDGPDGGDDLGTSTAPFEELTVVEGTGSPRSALGYLGDR